MGLVWGHTTTNGEPPADNTPSNISYKRECSYSSINVHAKRHHIEVSR